MIVINSVGEKYFTLNGIQHGRIFQPLKQGTNAVGIYSIYDTKLQLVNSSLFSDFIINGVTYATLSETISALLGVVWAQNANESESSNVWITKLAAAFSSNQILVDDENLLEGQAIKFVINAIAYYGIIDAIDEGVITISSNKQIGGVIQEFYYALNKVNKISYVLNNDTVNVVGTSIQRAEGNIPIKLDSGHIAKIETYCHAGTLLKLKVMNGANHIYTQDADGLPCTAQTFNNSGVFLDAANTFFKSSQELDIDIVTAGSNVENAVIHIYQIIGV